MLPIVSVTLSPGTLGAAMTSSSATSTPLLSVGSSMRNQTATERPPAALPTAGLAPVWTRTPAPPRSTQALSAMLYGSTVAATSLAATSSGTPVSHPGDAEGPA